MHRPNLNPVGIWCCGSDTHLDDPTCKEHKISFKTLCAHGKSRALKMESHPARSWWLQWPVWLADQGVSNWDKVSLLLGTETCLKRCGASAVYRKSRYSLVPLPRAVKLWWLGIKKPHTKLKLCLRWIKIYVYFYRLWFMKMRAFYLLWKQIVFARQKSLSQ